MKHKITIPKPCHENWDEMTPKDNGRYCMSCSKTVTDFTSMLPDQVQHFFIQNQNHNICGRFKKSQLDKLTIQSRILYTQTHYPKMFLLVLFFITGTTLFSCTDKDGNKKQNDETEVVDGTKKNQNDNLKQVPLPMLPSKEDKSKHSENPIQNNNGEVISSKTTSDKSNSEHSVSSSAKTDQDKFIKPEENLNNQGKEKKNTSTKKELKAKTEAVTNKNADLPGGIEQFYTFFENEYKKPENTSKLKIRISFAIEKNGSLSYIESDPAIDKPVETEIIRVLSLSPKWQPGESNGKKIRMQYSLPIVLQ